MDYDLTNAAKHIVHDYAYLVSAGYDTQNPLPFPFNHYAERTFLVHCRAFAGFFSNGHDDRDMYARHFVNGSSAATVEAWEPWHKHMDQHLAHLTKARTTNKRSWTGEDNKAILDGFQQTWREFYRILEPSLKPDFDAQLAARQKEFPNIPLT